MNSNTRNMDLLEGKSSSAELTNSLSRRDSSAERFLNSIETVFDACKDVKVAQEEDEVEKGGGERRRGGSLLISKISNDGVQYGDVAEYAELLYIADLGPLTAKQREAKKQVVYPNAANRKTQYVAIAKDNAKPFPENIPIGSVLIPGTDVIVSFSGFLAEKDELFVLALLLENNLITKEHADEIAKAHSNEVYHKNIEEVMKRLGYGEDAAL